MNQKKYIEAKLRLYFEIKKYLKQPTDKENYFYFINIENYNILNKEFSFLSNEDKFFLEIYFKNDLTINEKIKLLEFHSSNEYYNKYRKIVSTIIKGG